MIIKSNTQLAEAIHSNYLLLPILNRFDIQLGFGNKTVKQVCNEKGVNISFFLEIINSFLNEDYFPQNQLQSFPMKLIIEYINRSHVYYTDLKIPQIENLMNKLYQEAPDKTKKSFQLIIDFFAVYKKELFIHIENEEENVHPYILKIDDAYQYDKITPEIKEMVKEESINNYVDEHDNVEDKLFDLKSLIIKYLPPASDYTLSNSLLFELFRLERDLNDHSRIEEKILVPKVQLIEEQILKNLKQKINQ
jgi:regulator of cell morphogenesis and NO signaling